MAHAGTILEVPLGCFLSTFNHDRLPSCSSVQHKCKESKGLILPSLRFASKSLLQIFIKVSSLVGLVAELLLRLLQSFYCCQSPRIHVQGFVAQCNNKRIHHPIATCNSSHISLCLLCETQYVSNTKTQVPCLCKHQQCHEYLTQSNDCITIQICTKAHLLLFSIKVG